MSNVYPFKVQSTSCVNIHSATARLTQDPGSLYTTIPRVSNHVTLAFSTQIWLRLLFGAEFKANGYTYK